ncbi:MAG: hypothetical protein HQ500_10650 [Flavobacteriales bacterium]|nr:hypothetical protein [Flavobacteriales bacterium]
MLRRLRIYFTGFGIGLVMVYFMFMRDDSRDLDIWTPSQRVLEDIRNDSVFQSTPRLACFQACNDLSDEVLMQLWTDADVKSLNPGGDPYRYSITLETDDLHLEAELERRKRFSLLFIKDLENPTDCDCD